jgi:hypothetical protein
MKNYLQLSSITSSRTIKPSSKACLSVRSEKTIVGSVETTDGSVETTNGSVETTSFLILYLRTESYMKIKKRNKV